MLVSDYSGSASVLHKAASFGIDLKSKDPKALAILTHLKELEGRGFQFEGAEASFELLMKRILGLQQRFFEFKGARVIVEKRQEREEAISEATVKLIVDGKTEHTVAEGKGPVNALDSALRKALYRFYPALRQMELHRLQGARAHRRGRHGGAGARADRVRRQRGALGHRRGLDEHHRGLLAGARRRDRVQAAQRPVGGGVTGCPGPGRRSGS